MLDEHKDRAERDERGREPTSRDGNTDITLVEVTVTETETETGSEREKSGDGARGATHMRMIRRE